MNNLDLNHIAEKIAERLREPLIMQGPDLTITDIARITGVSKAKAYLSKYHGEYRINGMRRIRRDVFFSRRQAGMDVCI